VSPAKGPEPEPDWPAQPQSPPQPRSKVRLTSRAAALAVVLCAVTLSLAYPVREYIAQRRQIDQLEAQHQVLARQLKSLQTQQRELGTPAYIEQLAEDRLHMCLPSRTCYVVIGGSKHSGKAAQASSGAPWYERLWSSVLQADRGPAR
jgi:cell division protein FtsL